MTVGSTTLTLVGNSDIFMIKLDASGSPAWAKSLISKEKTGYIIYKLLRDKLSLNGESLTSINGTKRMFWMKIMTISPLN